MGKTGKTGKGRRDKFYSLAKEQGYRSRAAFKLIQLNKKFDFLSSARTLIDLCAAPGGWLQVAERFMPADSLIIGVDLVPIPPIPRVTSFADDIGSQSCRSKLKSLMKSSKADVVIHDGSPNMGVSWAQDAYGQSELTLMATKLATDFLKPGGLFVTKVFRSRDYNSLLWVFRQLFRRVSATKPAASRNVSAEIYCVCEGFLAPHRLDPKLLDPRYIFKEIADVHQVVDVMATVRKKPRQRGGYADGATVLYRKGLVSDFIGCEDPVDYLGRFTELQWSDACEQRYGKHTRSNTEIRACVSDIRVLGKAEVRQLLRWRDALRRDVDGVKLEEDGAPVKSEQRLGVDSVVTMTDEQLEQHIDEELAAEVTNADKRSRKREKKERERRKRLQQRIDRKMFLPDDIIDITPDYDLFGLTLLNDEHLHHVLADDAPGARASQIATAPAEERGRVVEVDTRTYDEMVEDYFKAVHQRRMQRMQDVRYRPKFSEKDEARVRSADTEALVMAAEEGEALERAHVDDEEPIERLRDNHLLASSSAFDSESRLTDQWFSQSVLTGAQETDDERERAIERARQRLLHKMAHPDDEEPADDNGDKGNKGAPPSAVKGRSKKAVDDDADANDDFEEVPADEQLSSHESDDEDARVRTLALGAMVVRGDVSMDQLVDSSYNRYTYDDDVSALPQWFVHEENEHNRPDLPVTKEVMAEMRAKLKAIDARPIKKVAEAKARKKRRAMAQTVKAKQKAQAIVANAEMTERDKLKQVKRLFEKIGKERSNKVYVTTSSAKERSKKRVVRGKKVGGKHVMVDRRLKADKVSMARKRDPGARKKRTHTKKRQKKRR